MKALIIIFVGWLGIAAQADPGLPRTGTIVTDISAPDQTVQISNIDLHGLTVNCDGASSTGTIKLNQNVSVAINGQTYSVNSGFATVLFKHSDCLLTPANISMLIISGLKRSSIKNSGINLALDLENKTMRLSEPASGGVNLGKGDIVAWY